MTKRSFTKSHIFFILWFISLLGLWYIHDNYRYDWSLSALFGVVSLLGVVMTIDLMKDGWLSIKAKDWPKAIATVKSSQLRTNTRGGSGHTVLRYWADFDFSYCVAGTEYIHQYQNPNPTLYSTQKEVKDFIEQVEAGKYFSEVYYNASNPQVSFIEPGLLSHHRLGIPIGLMLIVVPILTHFEVIVWQ